MLLLSVSPPLIYNGKAARPRRAGLPYGCAQSPRENLQQKSHGPVGATGGGRGECMGKSQFSCEPTAVFFALNGKFERWDGRRIGRLLLPRWKALSALSRAKDLFRQMIRPRRSDSCAGLFHVSIVPL